MIVDANIHIQPITAAVSTSEKIWDLCITARCVLCQVLTIRVKIQKVARTWLHDSPRSRISPAQPAIPGAVTIGAYGGQYSCDTYVQYNKNKQKHDFFFNREQCLTLFYGSKHPRCPENYQCAVLLLQSVALEGQQ